MRYFVTVILGLFLGFTTNAQGDYNYSLGISMSISSDETLVAVSGRFVSDSSARLGLRFPIDFYELTSGELVGSFVDIEDGISGLSLNSDGSLLAYSTNNGQLGVVDVQSRTEQSVLVTGGFNDIGYPIWAPNDLSLASFTGLALNIYDYDPPRRVSFFAPDSTTGVVGFDWSRASDVIVYSTKYTATGEGVMIVLNIEPTLELTELKRIAVPASFTISLSNDGTRVATTTENGALVTNISDSTQVLLEDEVESDVIRSLAWNADDTKLAAGGDDKITVWDTATGEIVTMIPTVDRVRDLFWSIDGQFIYHTGGSAGIYRNGIPLQEIVNQ